MLKKNILIFCLVASSLISGSLMAATYDFDVKGAHAFIQFRIKHLGYSWLYGRFNRFNGSFEYDKRKPKKHSVMVEIDTASVDSNHAERDKHLRSEKFLDVEKYPTATFKSTGYTKIDDRTGTLEGELTLHGVTKPISIEVTYIGGGADPWGSYRQGFEGTTQFALADFGIDYNLGPESKEVEMTLSVEGIRRRGSILPKGWGGRDYK